MLSYIEVSRENLIHNILEFRKVIPKTSQIAAVIKANAYGHGQNEVAKAVNELVDYFQVDDFEELKLLKTSDVQNSKPVLVLGYVQRSDIEKALDLGAILTIYDIEQVRFIDQTAEKLNITANIHICIDSCLGRDGILLADLDTFVHKLKLLKNVKIEGVYSHFANIEDTTDLSHAKLQEGEYMKAVKVFEEHGFSDLKKHICATSGILVGNGFKPFPTDIVRIGIGLYGLWPSQELKASCSQTVKLKPALRWISKIAQIKTLPANYTVGYGLTFITTKETKIAIIPQGYSDGYDRGLSNIGEVLIKDKRCRVIGRISMNMMTVDISDVENVQIEDEVIILGKQEENEVTAEEIAEKIGTINYEITARISALIYRRLI